MKKFKDFLAEKGISEEEFAKKSPAEVAALQMEYNDAQVKAAQDALQKAFDEAKKGLATEEQLKKAIEGINLKAEGEESEAMKAFKLTLDGYKSTIDGYEQKMKELAGEITSLKAKGVVNQDLSINKSVIREIVEKHFKDAGLLGEEETNEHGIKVRALKFNANSNDASNKTNTRQIVDAKRLAGAFSQKAGENMFVGGTNTQAVFNQGINRSPIGTISDPLTANQHALDIFNVTGIKGSLMTLLIFKNLEANGELVTEGTAPSADSRIELDSKDFKVFDVIATATIGKNLLADSEEVINELVLQLESNLKTVLDNSLFVSGGDNTDDPWGIFNTTHSCEIFNPLLFTGTSQKANIISVIGKAKLQARLNDWATDATILNPKQWDAIEDLKDVDENSIRDNRLAVNAVGEIIAVKGMMKYQTTKMPEGTLLVYKSLFQNIGLRQDIETEFGYNNDDFKKRKIAFNINMRAAYGQKAIKSAIYVADIAAAIAILKESAAASLTRVQAYATADNAAALTIATLANAGVTGALEANLADYKVSVAGAASIANLAALQALIDADNA